MLGSISWKMTFTISSKSYPKLLWHSVLIFQSKLYTLRLCFSEVLNNPFWPETLCIIKMHQNTSKKGVLRSTGKSTVGKGEPNRKLVCFARSLSLAFLLGPPVQSKHCQVAAEELICQALWLCPGLGWEHPCTALWPEAQAFCRRENSTALGNET